MEGMALQHMLQLTCIMTVRDEVGGEQQVKKRKNAQLKNKITVLGIG